MSGQLVIYCRILRHMQDDPDTQDALKRDISSLAVMLLEEAHTNSTHLQTLNHSVALPFAALLASRLSAQPEDIIIRCALRFAGDPTGPASKIPTFVRFNAEQMMAIAYMDSSIRPPRETDFTGGNESLRLPNADGSAVHNNPLRSYIENLDIFQLPQIYDLFAPHSNEHTTPPHNAAFGLSEYS